MDSGLKALVLRRGIAGVLGELATLIAGISDAEDGPEHRLYDALQAALCAYAGGVGAPTGSETHSPEEASVKAPPEVDPVKLKRLGLTPSDVNLLNRDELWVLYRDKQTGTVSRATLTASLLRLCPREERREGLLRLPADQQWAVRYLMEVNQVEMDP